MSKSSSHPSAEYGGPERHGDRVELPTPNARQGVTGHNVRYVLLLSIGIVIAILAAIYLLVVGA